jgi:hypothetical protein
MAILVQLRFRPPCVRLPIIHGIGLDSEVPQGLVAIISEDSLFAAVRLPPRQGDFHSPKLVLLT